MRLITKTNAVYEPALPQRGIGTPLRQILRIRVCTQTQRTRFLLRINGNPNRFICAASDYSIQYADLHFFMFAAVLNALNNNKYNNQRTAGKIRPQFGRNKHQTGTEK